MLSLDKKGGSIPLSTYTVMYLRLQTYSEFNTLLDWIWIVLLFSCCICYGSFLLPGKKGSENKKALLLFLFKLQTLIGIHFPFLAGSIIKFLTFVIKTFFSPMAWIFFFRFIGVLVVRVTTTLPSGSTSCPASWSTYWPTSWPTSWPTFYCVSWLVVLLILILPVHSIFFRDAALVLVDDLLSLDVRLLLVDRGPIGWGVFSWRGIKIFYCIGYSSWFSVSWHLYTCCWQCCLFCNP